MKRTAGRQSPARVAATRAAAAAAQVAAVRAAANLQTCSPTTALERQAEQVAATRGAAVLQISSAGMDRQPKMSVDAAVGSTVALVDMIDAAISSPIIGIRTQKVGHSAQDVDEKLVARASRTRCVCRQDAARCNSEKAARKLEKKKESRVPVGQSGTRSRGRLNYSAPKQASEPERSVSRVTSKKTEEKNKKMNFPTKFRSLRASDSILCGNKPAFRGKKASSEVSGDRLALKSGVSPSKLIHRDRSASDISLSRPAYQPTQPPHAGKESNLSDSQDKGLNTNPLSSITVCEPLQDPQRTKTTTSPTDSVATDKDTSTKRIVTDEMIATLVPVIEKDTNVKTALSRVIPTGSATISNASDTLEQSDKDNLFEKEAEESTDTCGRREYLDMARVVTGLAVCTSELQKPLTQAEMPAEATIEWDAGACCSLLGDHHSSLQKCVNRRMNAQNKPHLNESSILAVMWLPTGTSKHPPNSSRGTKIPVQFSPGIPKAVSPKTESQKGLPKHRRKAQIIRLDSAAPTTLESAVVNAKSHRNCKTHHRRTTTTKQTRDKVDKSPNSDATTPIPTATREPRTPMTSQSQRRQSTTTRDEARPPQADLRLQPRTTSSQSSPGYNDEFKATNFQAALASKGNGGDATASNDAATIICTDKCPGVPRHTRVSTELQTVSRAIASPQRISTAQNKSASNTAASKYPSPEHRQSSGIQSTAKEKQKLFKTTTHSRKT